jgi:hypothetical protein
LIVEAVDDLRGHGVSDLVGPGIIPFGYGANRNVAIRENAHEAVIVADGQGTYISILHFLGRFLERAIRMNGFDFSGHDIFDQHGISSFWLQPLHPEMGPPGLGSVGSPGRGGSGTPGPGGGEVGSSIGGKPGSGSLPASAGMAMIVTHEQSNQQQKQGAIAMPLPAPRAQPWTGPLRGRWHDHEGTGN